MQITPTQSAYDAYAAALRAAEEHAAPEGEQPAAEAAAPEDPNVDKVDFRTLRDQERAFWQQQVNEMHAAGENKTEDATSKPSDASSQLTSLLVSAAGQFEVRQVIALASKEMLGLQVTAATGNGDDAKLARQILKKLQKVIDRGYKKIEGLNGEDQLRLQQRRAEQAKQRQRAGEIKEELRQRIKRRKDQERKYLNEDDTEKMPGALNDEFNPFASAELDAATEAQIAVQAEAQAAVEVSAEGGAGAGGGVAVAGGAAAAAATGGGGAEGGGGEAAVAEGGGLDISV